MTSDQILQDVYFTFYKQNVFTVFFEAHIQLVLLLSY